MISTIIYILYFIAISNAQSTETILDQSTLTCFNDTDCDLSESTNDSVRTATSQAVSEATSKSKNLSVNATTVSPRSTTLTSPASLKPQPIISTHQSHGGSCDCDLTMFSCDVNCCCDADCRDLNVTDFFSCKDHRPKVYDARYCYENNLIEYNNTRYFLEKLRDNLFCIVYDNPPPVYSTNYDPIISNRNMFDEIVSSNKKSRFKWDQSTLHFPKQFNSDHPYRYGDIIWKIQNNFIKKLELPQTGFTGICSFKKALKYLEDWTHSCMQINLDNTNAQLFAKAFNNFSVIASPVLYNDSNISAHNESCPRGICIPVKTYYCLDSWIFCQNESTNGSCNDLGCRNIVKGARYLVTHRGIRGIAGVDVYLKIGNASEKFYQEFQVEHKWSHDDDTKVFHLSGNPGYIPGKPIIVGNLVTNKTDEADYSYVSIDRDEYFLSLPIGKIDGQCHEDHRYAVNFGEDLKLNCRIELQTRNFTINACVDLQRKIIDALLKNILINVTEVDLHTSYIAKWNHLNRNGTDDWVKILFDRIPQNVMTAQIIDDQLMCSGLVTSLRIDVVHCHLPEQQVIDNHKILGVAISFSDDSDMYWDKCEPKNCTDILSADVVSYVMFHDVSQPTKYFFVDGPNLDITLPHDFFYPFISNAPSAYNSNPVFILCTSASLVIVKNLL